MHLPYTEPALIECRSKKWHSRPACSSSSLPHASPLQVRTLSAGVAWGCQHAPKETNGGRAFQFSSEPFLFLRFRMSFRALPRSRSSCRRGRATRRLQRARPVAGGGGGGCGQLYDVFGAGETDIFGGNIETPRWTGDAILLLILYENCTHRRYT